MNSKFYPKAHAVDPEESYTRRRTAKRRPFQRDLPANDVSAEGGEASTVASDEAVAPRRRIEDVAVHGRRHVVKESPSRRRRRPRRRRRLRRAFPERLELDRTSGRPLALPRRSHSLHGFRPALLLRRHHGLIQDHE